MAAVNGAASVTLIRGADLAAAPWKNGGGVSREIAAFPSSGGGQGAASADFMWRVSVADVAQAGPFSRFDGVERTLVLLAGAGMLLDELGEAGVAATHVLREPLEIARFDGATRIDARLVDGATRDFNLMVRRDVAQGELQVWRSGTQPDAARSLDGDVVLLYCASGAVSAALAADPAQAVRLDAGDTLRIDGAAALACTLTGGGDVLAITIRYTR
jgi:environmental stress-induced protein Ves